MSAIRSASSITTISTMLEVDDPLRDEVLEPAGTGDEDVDAATHCTTLRLVADTAVDREDGAVADVAERRELTLDLRGELAGRARGRGRAGAWASARPTRSTSGMPKAMVLPEPVGALPQTSRPASRSGMVSGLDREGLGDAAVREHGDEVGGNAEIGEAGHDRDLLPPRGGTWPPWGLVTGRRTYSSSAAHRQRGSRRTGAHGAHERS